MNVLLTLLVLLAGAPLQERVPVSAPAVAAVKTPRVYTVYDIGDLVRPTTGAGAELDAVLRKQAQEAAAQLLISSIQSFVVPAFHPNLDELKATSATTLIALATQQQQDWIQAFLDLQRRAQNNLVGVQTSIVRGPRGAFGPLLGTDRSALTLEDKDVLAALLKTFEREPEFELVSSPRITMAPRQRGHIGVFNEVAYVKEYHLRVVHPGGEELADPIVETIREGIGVRVISTPIEDDLYAVELGLDLTVLERPIATRMVRVRAGKEGEFQVGMPEVNTVTVQSQLLLADGATAVLLAASPTEDRDLAIFITLKIGGSEGRAPHDPVHGSAPGRVHER